MIVPWSEHWLTHIWPLTPPGNWRIAGGDVPALPAAVSEHVEILRPVESGRSAVSGTMMFVHDAVIVSARQRRSRKMVLDNRQSGN